MNDKDIQIGLTTVYDGRGAAAALSDIDKVKAAQSAPAATVGSGNTGEAAGEKVLTEAVKASAGAKKTASKESAKLTDARVKGAAAAGEHADATLLNALAMDESARAKEREAAATEKDTAATGEGAATTEESSEVEREAAETRRRMMELEALGRKKLMELLKQEAIARKKAAAAGDVKAYKEICKRMVETRKALDSLNQAGQLNKLTMASQAQLGLSVGSTMANLSQQVKNGTVSVGSLVQAFLALSAAVKAGMGPIGWVLLAIQGLEMAWNLYADSQEKARKKARERWEAEQAALERTMKLLDEFTEKDRANALESVKREFTELEEQRQKAETDRLEKAKRADIAAVEAEEKRKVAADARYKKELATVDAAVAAGKITAADAERRRRAAEEARETELAAVEEAVHARKNAARLDDARAAEEQAEALQKALDEKSEKFGKVLTVKLPTPGEWEALQIKLQEGMESTEEIAFSREVHDKMNEVRAALKAMGVAWRGTDAELVQFVQQFKDATEEGKKRVEALREQARTSRLEAAEEASHFRQTKERHKAEAQERKAQAETAAAQQEQARLNEEWTLVQQRGSLEEQAEWLKMHLATMEEGSKLWKEYNKQLEEVNMRKIQKEVDGLAKEIKVTGTYAEEDRRSQYKILQDDKKALKKREERLKVLLEEAKDDATRKQIRDALEDTKKQQRGLAQATARNAAAARAMLKNYKAPRLKDKNKMVERNLNLLAKAYARNTRLEAQAAGKGNTKAVERYHRIRDKQAERLTKHSAWFAGQKKKDDEAILAATKKEAAAGAGGSKTAKKVAEEGRKQLGAARTKTRRMQKEAKGNADKTGKKLEAEGKKQLAASKKKTASLKKDAKTGASKSKDNTARLRSLEAQVKNMNAEKAKEGQAISELAAAVTTLANQASQAAGAATGAAGACAKATKSLSKQIANCQKQINRLMKEI